MATISNAMAGASVVPKYAEGTMMTVTCTQSIASGAASDQDYKLFEVGKGNSIVMILARMTTALESADTSNTCFHLGVASGGKTLVSSAQVNYTYPQRFGPDCTLPYTCTADGVYVYATLGVTTTAAGELIVVAKIAPTNNLS